MSRFPRRKALQVKSFRPIARSPPNILRPSPVVKVYYTTRALSAQTKSMPKCRSTENKPKRIVMKSVETLAVPTTATMATQTGASAPLPKPRACDPAALDIFPCDPCPKRIAKNRMPKSHAHAPCTSLCARSLSRSPSGRDDGNSIRSFPPGPIDRGLEGRSPADQEEPRQEGPGGQALPDDPSGPAPPFQIGHLTMAAREPLAGAHTHRWI